MKRLFAGRRERGAAEFSVLLLAGSVVAGTIVGSGVARTAVDVGDGLSWMADSPSGQVIEVNPATGKPQAVIAMGKPGQGLTVAQDRGRLVVSNTTTGSITSVDLATLVATGRRTAPAGDKSTVLLSGGQAFLVDRANNTVAAIDPVTMATIGRLWVGDKGVSDATVDRNGNLWVAVGDGSVVQLAWSTESQVFVERNRQAFAGVGSGARLVPHETGVTLVSPSTGAVVQVGTGHDLVSAAPKLRGTIAPAAAAESSLVPVSAPDTGTVVILEGSVVREVDATKVGCPNPGRPATADRIIYVPCLGSSRVVRLGPDGSKVGTDIVTPGSKDPEVLVDDGVVLVNTPGASSGVRIDSDGKTSTFVRYDPEVKPTNVDRKVPEPQVATKQAEADREKARDQAKKDKEQDKKRKRYDAGNANLPVDTGKKPNGTIKTGQGNGKGDGKGDGQGDGTSTGRPTTAVDVPLPTTTSVTPEVPEPPATEPPTTPVATSTPAGPAPAAPTGVSAASDADGNITVTWDHAGRTASSFAVLVDGSPMTTATGDARSATLKGLALGNKVNVSVRADFGAGNLASGAVGVTPHSRPGAPSGVAASEAARTRDDVTVNVSWGAAAANGSAISAYRVTANGGYNGSGRSVDVAGTSASLTLPCSTSASACGSGNVTITVTPINGVGSGPAGSASFGPSARPPMALPEAGATIVSGTQSLIGETFERSKDVELLLSAPASWRNFSGVCQVNFGGTFTNYACGAGSVHVEATRNGGRIMRTTHNVSFRAYDPADPGNVVTSASYSWNERWMSDLEDCNNDPASNRVPNLPQPCVPK